MDVGFSVEILVTPEVGEAEITCSLIDKASWGSSDTKGSYLCSGVPEANYGSDLAKGKITFGIKQCISGNQNKKFSWSVDGGQPTTESTVTLPLGNMIGDKIFNVSIGSTNENCGKN